jgi:hypothetical protein
VRKSLAFFTGAAAAAAVALLAACSGGMQGVNSGLPAGGVGASQSRFDLSRSGLPQSAILLRHFSVVPDKRHKKKGAKDLFVDDFGTNAVEVLKNKSWTNIGSISSGIDGPDGNFADKKGNLYVANYAGVNITEYKEKTGSSPTYTYNSGMTDPVAVTTDAKGNVYEGDYADGGSGFVNEYAQGSNTVVQSCSPGGAVEGVAVDAKGDVFVAYNMSSGARITEYTGGLKSCNGTVLGVSLGFAGGMVLDKNNDIIVCDQTAAAVDVIDPPYTSISGTLGSGYSDPFHVTLNKKEKEAYVADYAAADVQVLSYPSGSNIATLGSANGLSDPAAAVDGQNYVP